MNKKCELPAHFMGFTCIGNLGFLPVGVVDLDEHVSSHLKEELAWPVDKQLQIISTIMLFKKQ